MACVLWDTMIDCDQLIDLKMCFEECTICAILNMNWKLLQHQRVINIVHSLNKLRTISEQIDRIICFRANSLIRVFSKAAMFIYLVEWLLSMFAIHGKHVAEPRWPPVVHRTAKLSSRTDSKLQGLVNVNMNIRKSQPSVCTTVWTYCLGVSRNEFLLSPLESFVPYCFKSL